MTRSGDFAADDPCFRQAARITAPIQPTMNPYNLLRLANKPLKFMRYGIALFAIFITIWIENLPSGNRSWFANEWLRDQFIHLSAEERAEQRFVVIDIDEASLAVMGAWPWPRARIADMVEQLLGPYQARGVALDMVLPEPADAAGDTRLAMLSRFGPTVLAQIFDYEGNLPLHVGQIIPPQPAPAKQLAHIKASGFIANHAQLAQPDAKAGNIGFVPDKDGMVRRLPLYTQYQQQLYPSLSLALMQCCQQAQFQMPPSSNGFWRIPYLRTWSAYTVIPAHVILQQKLPLASLDNKLVLIGSSALGLGDRVATPLAANSSGLLVHAAALTYMLDHAEGKTAPAWPGRTIAYLYIALLALATSILFPRWSATANIALLLSASLLWLLLAFAIARHDAEFSVTAPLFANLFLLIVAVPFDWQVSQRMSRRLLGTLRQYVAPAVVDELLRSHLTDPLAPAMRHVTTLIADMEGYTSQVESLSAQDAANLTRDFLACLTTPVLEKCGTIDKYTGDGLVAFWGAPLPVADHADLAMEAAIGILRQVRAFDSARAGTGKPRLRVRIGIESGLAMAGDYGSSLRSIYTAVGDSVNVASRLEQVARDYPYDVIVGQGSAALVQRHQLILLGEIMLRGKEKPTTIYSLSEAATLGTSAAQVPK